MPLRSTRSLFLLALLAALSRPALAAPAPAPAAVTAPASAPRLAVLELKAGQGVEQKSATSLTAVLAGDAARVGFAVISQADVVAILSYQKMAQMVGCSDAGCMAEVGGALGADYVLSGEVSVVGTRAHQTLTLLDARRARVVARSAGFSEPGQDPMALALLARFRAVATVARRDLLAVAPPVEPPNAARLRSRRTAAWWTMGSGGALLAGGAVMGLMARSQAGALEGAWHDADYKSKYDKQRRTALTADVLLGAGLVTTGVGYWLYRTSEVPVVVVPVAAGDQIGLAVAGRF